MKKLKWWQTIWTINVFCLICTFYVAQRGSEAFKLFKPFHLGWELNVATWWSGIQLMFTGLLAHSISTILRPVDKIASLALLSLSLVLLALFFDEVGSFHERVRYFIPLEGDLGLLPFAFVGMIFVSFSICVLYKRRESFGSSWWLIILAFVLFVSVYAQEFIEHYIVWSEWLIGLRVSIEEGTELIGIFLLLYVVLNLRRRIDTNAGEKMLPDKRTLVWGLKVAAVIVVPLIIVRSHFTIDELFIPRKGDFGSMIIIFLFAICAIKALICARENPEKQFSWWVLSTVFIILSIDAEVHFHRYLYFTEDTWWRNDVGLIWGMPLLTLVALKLPGFRLSYISLLSFITIVVVFYSVISLNVILSMAVPTVVAFVVFKMLTVSCQSAFTKQHRKVKV